MMTCISQGFALPALTLRVPKIAQRGKIISYLVIICSQASLRTNAQIQSSVKCKG